jgi:two-component system invasion response regulator UvrY
MPRVLIADDNARVRSAYRQLFDTDPPVAEVGEAADAEETLDALRSGTWDLLVMEIQTPDRSGLEIVKHLTAGFPSVRVLVVSGSPEEHYARSILRAGARGYLAKDDSPRELVKAVRRVSSGQRYVSASLPKSLAEELNNPRDVPRLPHEELSMRELQIMTELGRGMPVGRIAAEFKLSAKTVSTYRSRILEKMHFMSNDEITAYAKKNRLMM